MRAEKEKKGEIGGYSRNARKLRRELGGRAEGKRGGKIEISSLERRRSNS